MEQSRYATVQAIGSLRNRSMGRFVHSDIMKINLVNVTAQVLMAPFFIRVYRLLSQHTTKHTLVIMPMRKVVVRKSRREILVLLNSRFRQTLSRFGQIRSLEERLHHAS